MSFLCNDGKSMGICSAMCGRKQKRKITLLLLGLDNAGKTSTAKCLLNDSPNNVAPTVGFSSVKPRHKKFDVTIYDLGGGQRIRNIWKNYFAEAHGLIFVVDASEAHRLDECRESFQELVKNPKISGKPILLLANKQDQNNALDEIDVCEALDLERFVNEYKCVTKVETCSAVGRNGKIDNAIKDGFHWLVDTIGHDYVALSSRVSQAVLLQQETEEKANAERLERVRKLRAEREKIEKNSSRDDQEDFITDPFRPISTIREELEKQDKFHLEQSGFTNNKGAGRHSNPQLVSNGDSTGFVTDPTGDHITRSGSHDLMDVKGKKKKKRFGKHNKTAPLQIESENSSELPPIQPRGNNIHSSNSMLEPITNPPKSAGSTKTWGLAEDLEPYFPPGSEKN